MILPQRNSIFSERWCILPEKTEAQALNARVAQPVEIEGFAAGFFPRNVAETVANRHKKSRKVIKMTAAGVKDAYFALK